MKKNLHTSILLIVFSLCSFLVHAVSNPNFSVAPNGVTCLCPDAAYGETGELTINGVTQTYTKRTLQQLRDLIDVNQNDPQIALTCTSGITDMTNLFSQKSAFNQDISSWDVSNVTHMINLFLLASNFNQPLNDWDVSNVTHMNAMFAAAASFNQPLNNWDVSSVTFMNSLFDNAASFNQPLNDWDVSSVTNMDSMFAGASSFNQSIIDWDVSNVTNMRRMFLFAPVFNQPINNWDVSSVTDMFEMFRNASSFNQDISSWCVEQIATEPSNFSTNSPLQVGFQPNWGMACFYVGDNGVTCFCPTNDFGDTGTLTINGVTQTYTKRTRQQLLDLINANQNDPQIALTCTSGITDMSNLFLNKSAFNQDISTWDVSNVTDMGNLFLSASSFNQPLNDWDVSSVTDMNAMFAAASSFNQPLNNWDVSSVINMNGVFFNASSFNQPLNDWDMSSVTNIGTMFLGAFSFNQPLNDWDVSNMTNMEGLFASASSFNQDISNWCVEQIASEPSNFSTGSSLQASFQPNWGASCTFFVGENGVTCFCPDAAFGETGELTINGVTQTYTKRTEQQLRDLINANPNDPQIALTCTSGITDMYNLFSNKGSFNQDISTWDVSNVITMKRMFRGALVFNQPLNDWDVSSVTDMSQMFRGALDFNQPLNNWDVSNVTDMKQAFEFATAFDQPLNNWDVSSVTDMSQMFSEAFSFNQPLSDWDVSSVSEMLYMFWYAISFNQYISNWCVEQITSEPSNFSTGSPLQASFQPNWGASCTFFVGENGVTCFCPNAAFGETAELTINGVTQTYTKRTRQQLLDLINANQNDPQIALTCTSGITDMSALFFEKDTFNQDISTWDVSNVTDMGNLFLSASNFNQPLNDWDVSNVTNMRRMFLGASAFNQPLNDWDVSSVTNMAEMFRDANSFNANIGDWDVGNVELMIIMFMNAESFNQDIGSWNVENVTNMTQMFRNASSFNQDIGGWDTSSLTFATGMFLDASSFNQDLNNWDVSGISSMSIMFSGATAFNGNISSWNVGNVNNMVGAFKNAAYFNQDISDWDVSNVTNMFEIFRGANSFNADISNWDVSNVNNLSFAFVDASSFNQNISGWNVSNVTTLSGTFYGASSFNQDIGAWDVSNVSDMRSTFHFATSFDQDLGNWDISNILPFPNGNNGSMRDMFTGTALSRSNYDNTLIGWSTLDTDENQIPQNVTFSGGNSKYCLSENARTNLINNFNWIITDDGLDTGCSLPTLISLTPQANATNIAPDTNVVLTFDAIILGSLVNANNILVHGNQTGTISGIFSGGGTNEITFNPTNNFKPGELITVSITAGLVITNPTVFSFTASVSPTSPGVFVSGQNVISAAADGARSVFSADLDGDGDLDIISASENDDKVAWYENDGMGNFGAQQIISATAGGAFSVHAADIDGDGDMDVLTATFSDNNVIWYENDGNGNFGSPQIISSLVSGVRSVFAADIDGDGDMDVLSASQNDDKIAWYENDGTGNFGPQQVISTLADGALSVFAADMDGDGDLDVLSASFIDNKIAWYENDGLGNFGPQEIISTSVNVASSVYAVDIDGDGDMDVLSASFNNNEIAWYENDGTGNFGTPQIISTLAEQATSVYAADIDGDGDMDVLSASRTDNKIAWYENDGDGNFGAQQIISNLADGAQSVYTADIDGDGDLDVISASFDNGEIAWYENKITPFALTATSPIANATNIALDANVVLTFDAAIMGSLLNANNILVHGNQTGSIPGTFSGSGTNEVTFNPTNNFKPGELITVSITAGLGITNPTVFSFTTTVNPASPGEFVNGQNVITTDADGARSVFSADLDGDGDIDVLSASGNDAKIAWYENDGLGNFGTQQIISTSADGAFSVYAGDLDGDGDMDVLAAAAFDDEVVWHENDGTDSFGTQQIITTSADGAFSVYAADIDGDGDLDVLSASFNDDKIAWYENDGNGSFGTQQIISTSANGALSVYAADIDGDGDMDVLSASFFDDKIAWYENDGNGNFGTQQIISNLANGAAGVYAADIDGDGDLDVLSASNFDDKIAWYENDGTGNFGTQQVISTLADVAQSVYAADIDGDRDLDVLSASQNDDKIAWYENGAFLRTNWTGNVDEDWENNLNWNKGMPNSEAIATVEDISLNTPMINESTSAETNQLLIGNIAALNVHGILKVVDNIENNGQITFKSNTNKTGQLDEFTGTYSGTGTVEVERFIPAGDNEKRAFRFLSSSVNSTENIRANWQEGVNNTGTIFPSDNQNPNPGFGTHITGSLTGTNGFDASGSGNPSLFLFNPTSQSWNAIANTDVNTLEVGKGYRLMVRGDRGINLTSNGSEPSNTVLRAKGDLVFAPVDVSTDLAQGADQFSLVGNPYQAVVDFSSAIKTNLRDYVYVWDATLTGENGRGAYVVVEVSSNAIVEAPAASSSSATKFIAPNQAFFVRNTSAGNPTLIFNEGNKATTADQVEVFSTYSDFYINSRLYKTEDLLDGNTEVDAIGLRFNPNYTTLADDEDAEKLANPDENFAIINNGLRSINKQDLPTDGHEIELLINSYTSTNYSLTFDMENVPKGLSVFLNDIYLNTQTQLSAESVYDFTVDASIAASTAFNRFNLSFDTTTLGVEDNVFSHFSLYPNPTADGKFTIQTQGFNRDTTVVKMYNLLGQEVYNQKATVQANGEVHINASQLPAGMYMVELQENEVRFIGKLMVK